MIIASGNGTVASGWLAPATSYDKSTPAFEYVLRERLESLLAEAGASDLKLSARLESLTKNSVAVQEYWSRLALPLMFR